MSDGIKLAGIAGLTLVLIAWAIAWGTQAYAQTMVAGGMVQATIPVGYTTVWTSPGAAAVKP